MNRLSLENRVRIISCLVEGNSIRSTCRITGTAKGTVTRLLVEVGWACEVFQDKALRGLTCNRIECDEIWSFCGMKDKNVPKERRGESNIGDMWTWVALDTETKLVPCWFLGKREAWYANEFIKDLAERLAHRIQLTTDGLKLYAQAVKGAFGADVDYAMLIKQYGLDSSAEEKRYSPSVVTGSTTKVLSGKPDPDHISTSYIERQNLTMRMGMRRFTRLTNAFSKKQENLARALALHFMYYNFCRKHQTIKTTPAIAAGIADHTWTLHEVVRLADEIKRDQTAKKSN